MSLGSRIRFIRSQSGYNQTEFGDKIGAAQNTVSAWEKDKVVPADTAMVSICRTFNISEEWLRTGEGPMEVQRPKDEVIMKFFNSVLEDQPESIRKRFISSLAAFTPEDWEAAAALMQKLVKGME
jgi:transcriptional regulator with XRE-family HTH domain